MGPASPMPVATGIGLRAEHYQAVLRDRPQIGWLEIHAENYFGDGGAPLRYLDEIRPHYPLSIHCVGTSLGSVDALSREHLSHLAGLIRRYEPELVSDHLCWGSVGGIYFNDLLPLPYTEEALIHVSARVEQLQEYLGRQVLVENLSSYLQYQHSTIDEWDFLNELTRRSGCDILLDVNNIYVSACNHGFDARAFIAAINGERVGEVHLAGHAVNHVDGHDILIDDHASRVCDAVWELFDYTISRMGPKPCLIEWDTDVPELEVLAEEAARAQRVLEAQHALVA